LLAGSTRLLIIGKWLLIKDLRLLIAQFTFYTLNCRLYYTKHNYKVQYISNIFLINFIRILDVSGFKQLKVESEKRKTTTQNAKLWQ